MVKQALKKPVLTSWTVKQSQPFYSNRAFSFLSTLVLLFPLQSLDSAIVNGVYWSEALNKVFVDNFKRDPSLIWQYFGSAKGFFRQYPGKCVFVCEGGYVLCIYLLYLILIKLLSP